MAEAPTIHVVTHVHWDREWYRPFEAYRSRLVELVEQVCRQLDSGSLERFHLDGQTITLRDVGDLRPDLIADVRRHVQARRLTIGPWHVLADNQLVSGENLIRNLLTARRHGAAVGHLTEIGYSPDAFGHPADLPRILNGFGIDTALVWRGAPADLAQFEWRSPDGSSVYAVNHAYHEAEVLWTPSERSERLGAYVDTAAQRRPGGPWLLMNGGDHVAPRDTTGVLASLAPDASKGASLVQSSLEDFFARLRDGVPHPATVEGELRHLGGPGSFLLSGTLSARVHLKQENASIEAALTRVVEPLLAAESLTSGALSTRDTAPDAMAVHGDLRGHLRHAWELVLENSPHDSICGCSVDEVHRENSVRSERASQVAAQMTDRLLLRGGYDTRVHGTPATDEVQVAVFVPPAALHGSQPVEVDIVVAPDRRVERVLDPSGTAIDVESEDLGVARSFEADLDLLPDSVDARTHRLRFVTAGREAGSIAVYTVVLAALASPSHEAVETSVPLGHPVELSDGSSVSVAPDGSFDCIVGADPADEAGAAAVAYRGIARLVDGGDRGDSYTYDPPAADTVVLPRAEDVRVRRSSVRTVIRWTATLDTPASLDASRDARSDETVPTRISISVTHWNGRPGLEWSASFANAARDHRLRVHIPVEGAPTQWTSGQHYSSLTREFGPVLGALPDAPNREAEIGTHPAHAYARAGSGRHGVAVLLDHVSEVQGVEAGTDQDAELAVTLLRSVGWLSRFDLRTRTTGAGPELPAPEAQMIRPVDARLGFRFGRDAADPIAVAEAAESRLTPVVARQLSRRSKIPAPSVAAPVRVRGAVVSAFKPAEDGSGAILRLSNPSDAERRASVTLPDGTQVTRVRMDEQPEPGADTTSGTIVVTDGAVDVPLAAQQTVTLRLVPTGVDDDVRRAAR